MLVCGCGGRVVAGGPVARGDRAAHSGAGPRDRAAEAREGGHRAGARSAARRAGPARARAGPVARRAGNRPARCQAAGGAVLQRRADADPATARSQTRPSLRAAGVAARSTPTSHALVVAVRRSPVVAPDETGWKVGGRLWWLWVFVTRDVTVYAIQPGRGYGQAAAILGPRYGGVVVRDGWAPYRKLAHATHQTWLAHLLRRCHTLLDIAQRGAARYPHAVRRLLLTALAIRDSPTHTRM